MIDKIAPLPAALIEALTSKPRPNPPAAPTPARPGQSDGSRYAAAALRDELSRLRQARNGQRNDQLNRAAFKLGTLVGAGALDRATVQHELARAAADIGLSDFEASRTIQSGLGKGEAQPRAIPAPPARTERTTSRHVDPVSGEIETTKALAPTEDELRDRYLSEHPLTLHAGGKFRRYDPARGIWPEIDADTVRAEVVKVLEAAKPEGIRPTARLMTSVVEMLRVSIVKPAELLDNQPTYIPCRNGVFDQATGALYAHSPAYLLTTAMPYAYDPTATAPTWEWFLQNTIPEAAAFLQEFAGYATTTDTRHEIALWLQGPPGSGKSTCLSGLQTMLGERAGLLGLADIERNRFALSNLPGKTLAVATEQPADYIASTHILNAIISGEPVTVERKYFDPVEVVTRAKLAWAMNSLPRVGDTNSGLFRRVKVVRFKALPEAQRDPTIKDAIASEGAGILNWALVGLARLHARGRFDVPASVKDATEQFRASNDIPAQFLAECCLLGPEYKTKAGTLYTAYKDWCFKTGHKAQSMTSLAVDWDRLGLDKYVAAGSTYRRGVGLLDEGGL